MRFGRKIRTGRGKANPLGATVQKNGINFAVYSSYAAEVTLYLYLSYTGKIWQEIDLDSEYNKTGDIWHIFIYGIDNKEVQYGYRIYGDPEKRGFYYKCNEILLDPYAKAIYNFRIDNKNIKKSGKKISCVIDDEFDWQNDIVPKIPWKDTIIYELHVRGFTKHHTSKTKYSGTYLGLIEKIPYLKKLGITAVELLPIFEFDEYENENNNPHTKEKLKNFWGYSTIGFFAPKTTYAYYTKKNKQVQEFKTMVRALHKENIEVILDIVLNHTGEGNGKGPTLHFKALDNPVYYILDNNGKYLNFSGCGNSVNCNNPVVMDFIIDCLKYWVIDNHVDGFRFDLASILVRNEKGIPLQKPPIIERIATDPVLKNVKLIAEPWDAGGLYQVGRFPGYPRWAEWNGKFRDDVRAFVKGDEGVVQKFANRLIGSPDIYKYRGNSTYQSINFVTCHDGFTLNDLVSYNSKHNMPNGENNRDGENNNLSWNYGYEGPTSDEKIMQIRNRQVKMFMSLLLLSQGVPMILCGDEFGRTQNGNNNAYCQDNDISWVDWSLAEKNKDFLRFVREMIHFRKRHSVLRKREFSNLKLIWHGVKEKRTDWSHTSHSIAFTLEDENEKLYVAINCFWKDLVFEIPDNSNWKIIIDTAKKSPDDIIRDENEAKVLTERKYRLVARSLLVLGTKK